MKRTVAEEGQSMPSVTVIIPTYNRAYCLGQALDSLLGQTYPGWEAIVVDDGSEDDTVALLERYTAQHPQIRYLHQPHKGVSAARNLGISHAQTEYISFLDSDDEWLPDNLKTQLPYFNDPSVGMTFSYYSTMDPQGGTLVARNNTPIPLDRHIYPALLTIAGNYIVTPAVIARRTVIAEAGGFDESMITCEDIDLWRRIARGHEVRAVAKVLVRIRIRPDHDSSSFAHRVQARLELYRKAFADDPTLRPTYGRLLLHEMYFRYSFHALRNLSTFWLGIGLLGRALWNYPIGAAGHTSLARQVSLGAAQRNRARTLIWMLAALLPPVRRHLRNHRALVAQLERVQEQCDTLIRERDALREELSALRAQSGAFADPPRELMGRVERRR